MDGCTGWLHWMLTWCWSKRDFSCASETNGRDDEEENDGVEGPLAILWDIDNCCIPSGLSPEIVVDSTRKYLRKQGIKAPITLFSAYGDFSNWSSSRRESCQWSGVNLIHVSNRKKEAADKVILVDMLLFAMDNPPPSSILLISGDVDFAAALHKLGQRGHFILVAAVNLTQTSDALLSTAKFVWEWPQMASNGNLQNQNPTSCGRFEPQSLPNAGNYSEIVSKSNPDLSMQVSKGPNNCGLFAETISKPSPASLMQDSELKQSGIDVVKEEILSLIHRKGGCITFGEIPVFYQHTFEKTLSRKRCGFKLKTLLEMMGDDIQIHGQGNTACVYLISHGKCLCPQSNMNSDAPNHKNATGCGLPFETEIKSNRTHMMQPSKIEVSDSGLPSQKTTKPYPISSLQPCNISLSAYRLPYETTKPQSTSSVRRTTKRPSDLDVVKKELLTLLSGYRGGIRLSKMKSLYKQTFKKELRVKDYGSHMKTMLQMIGNDIYIQGKCGGVVIRELLTEAWLEPKNIGQPK